MGDNRKRVSVKHNHPNPLFEKWLTEWRDKAKEKNSKMQHCFSLALSTLRKYPLPLESGKDCKILKGFGEKLCKMLDDKLKQHKAENSGAIVHTVPSISKVQSKKINSPGKKIEQKEYIPQSGSGAFAILVTLYEKSVEPGYSGYSTKKEIIESGQHLCNVSFTKPGPDSRYTGWSSMRTLLEKKMVTKQGNPARFTLTSEGSALADKLYVQQKIDEFKKLEENETGNVPLCLEDVKNQASTSELSSDIISTVPSCSKLCSEKQMESTSFPKNKSDPIWRQTSSNSTSTQSSITHETVILAPNSFEIILLVDNQELNGSKGDLENDPIIRDLKSLNVHHEVKDLKVGDYTWICRDSYGNEMVLPYIVERKRMDDLGKSIKDDRFHEQKFRLKQCGIQNLIYLIENHGKNEHVGLPINTLYQAAVNTLIHDNFTVKFTENGKASCEYLACLTTFLSNLFKNKTLVSCPKDDLPPLGLEEDLIHLMLFKEFNKSSSKSRHFKVKEMFIRHLLQIKGMSVDKALAIVQKYPTPLLLKLSYSEVPTATGEKLLSNIQYGNLKKKIGPVLSKTVFQFFTNDCY